jgi:membrane-bound lytic murein transglycosylase D
LRWHRHRVRAGETLTTIATRYDTNVDTIKKVNKLDGNTVLAGNFISIPATVQGPKQQQQQLAASTPQIKPVAAAPRQTRTAPIQKTKHTVRVGDTLWNIAQRYGVSTSQVAAWNGMSTQDPIRVGQNLVIVKSDQRQTHLASASPETKKATRQVQRRVVYKVQKGDSLYGIARRFNVSMDAIKRWNQLRSERDLKAGQQLVLLLDVKGQGAV